MSLDEQRGLLYVPVSTPSSDYWGGRRQGQNLFAECARVLERSTGKIKWYFQAVHHGLWDYDFPAAPNLVTITVNGRRIDAVAAGLEAGLHLVFDRVTGAPVWPIENRGRRDSRDVPSEQPGPTQPFPTKPPAFAVQGVSLDDANDLTPEIKALAIEEMKKFRIGRLYTPPSLRGTLQRPTVTGGANWPGRRIRSGDGHAVFEVVGRCIHQPGLQGRRAESRTWTSNGPTIASSAALGAFQRAGAGPAAAPRRRSNKLGPIPWSSRPMRISWRSISTAARSRGRSRSAKAAPAIRRIRC